MFMTFGLFIGLIIVTIIMIALIIYLTFTGGKHNKSLQKKNYQAEEEAKERLAQNNLAMSHHFDHLDQSDSHHQNEFRHEPEADMHYSYQEESQPEETIDEDYSLHILPYPKDDDFK